MKVYFSGISGTGIGPLAELSFDAGYDVCGSDLKRGAIANELDKRNIKAFYGEQDGSFLERMNAESKIDWLVYSSALPEDHPELNIAKKLNIKLSKRDEFISTLVEEKDLKMIAIAGTHGKTTTTAMLIWAMQNLQIPASYAVGTTLGWAQGAKFDSNSNYFIYEADEYDRNFLAYHPYIGAFTCIDYDHPDIYPSLADYQNAFAQFKSQCDNIIENSEIDERINLVGELRRKDASIVLDIFKLLITNGEICNVGLEEVAEVLNKFPGAGRRFEKITEGVYSDYGHHPKEIKTTLAMAKELCIKEGKTGVLAIYQPHQNTRQYKLCNEYYDAFLDADKVFWTPTFLTREDKSLEILSPEQLITKLKNSESAEARELNDNLAKEILDYRDQNWLIILFSAGPADSWLREILE